MKKTNRAIAVFSVMGILFGASVQSIFADEGVIHKNFDANPAGVVNIDADGNTKSFSGTLDQFWTDVKEDHAVGFAEAPKVSSKVTTLTEEGSTDMAFMLKVNDQAAATTGAPWAQISTLPSDLYEKGKVRISCNIYIAKAVGDSHAPIQICLRTKGGSESQLVAYRTSKKMQFNASSTYETNTTYAYGSWYNIRFDIDTRNKTYIPYINGEVPELKTAGAIPMANAANVSFNSDDGNQIIEGLRVMVNGKGKSKGTEIYFDDLYVGDVVSNSTDRLIVDAFGFSDGSNIITEVPANTDKIYARATVTYSEKTARTPVSMLAALYGADLKLKGICKADDVIPETDETGEFQKELSMPVSFSEQYESGDGVVLYLWDGAFSPLSEPVGLNVKNENYFFDQSFTSRDSKGIQAYNLGTAEKTYMITSVTNELGGQYGYTFKIDCPFVPSSGTPYITISPNAITGDTVNIAFKLRQNRTHPKLLEVADSKGARKELLTFRPTGDIQIGGQSVGSAYTENVWTDYRFEMNTVSKDYIVYQNEKQIASGNYAIDFVSLRFTVQYNKNNQDGRSLIYMDDIKIY